MVNESTTTNKINIQDIIDFCFCPRFKKLKGNNNPTLLQEYNKALNKCYFTFIRQMINKPNTNLENSFETLKTAWGKEWIKENDFKSIQILPVNPHVDTYSKRRRNGLVTLCNFYDLITKYKQFPITVNKSYEFQIDDFTITGSWDYIREVEVNKTKRIQIVKIIQEETRHCSYIQDRKDLDTIAMCYAFEKTFNISDYDLVLLDANKNKQSIVKRSLKDYNLLINTCRYYKYCLDNNIYFVSPDIKCGICEYKNKCFNGR